MSVRSTALRLSIACRRAMPEAIIHIAHSRAPWGHSAYVHIRYGRIGAELYTKARVSDHGIGERRWREDTSVSLYLREGAAPGAWELWLARIAARYRELGGSLPALEGLFAQSGE